MAVCKCRMCNRMISQNRLQAIVGKYNMTQIANTATKTSFIQIRDLLFIQTQKLLKNQLRQKTQPLSLCISFCAVHLSDPYKILSLVQKFIRERKQLSLFFKALYFVSLRYISHSCKIEAIKKIYQKLLQITEARKVLLQNCDIPTQIRPLLNIKRIQDKDFQFSQQNQLTQTIKVTSNSSNRKGIIKLMVLLTQNTSQFAQDDFETMWKKILVIIGEFEMHPMHLLDFIVQSIIPSKKYEFAIFCFKKLATYISPSAIMNHLIFKQAKNIQYNHRDIKESSLASNMQKYSMNDFPLDSNITALVLLAKAKIINQKQIFLKLQPLSLRVIYYLNSKNEDQLNDSEHKEQIKKDRKQQFLTQLILFNAFDIFMNLVLQFKIKAPFLKYVPLYFSITEMIEWLFDPLFKLISYSHIFPSSRKRKVQNKIFLSGSFSQLTIVNKSLASIHTLTQVCGGSIFARRSLYLKLSRLFKAIFQNHQKLIIVEQDICEIRGFIYNCLYWDLIPAIQFYNQDSSIVTALNSVLQHLPIRYQHIVLLKSLESIQYQPQQLIQNAVQTSQQLKILLNKISNSNLHIIEAKIKQYVYSRPFVSLLQLLNRLLVGGTTCIMKSIIKIVSASHILIKKIFNFYVMNYLLAREDSLVLKNSHFSGQFNIFIDLINEYLVQDRQNAMLIGFLIQYIVTKFKPHSQPVVQMTNYQFFSSHIGLFSHILQYLLPIQMNQSSNLQQQSKHNSINGASVCLKIYFMSKLQQFMRCQHVRQNLTKCLLNKKNPFQTNFYKIIVLMHQLSHKIYLSSHYNQSHVVYYIDQINNLTNILIEFINYQTISQLKNTYFSFEIFDQLLNKYKIPLQICFTLLRRSIFDKYSFSQETSFFSLQDWQRIKANYQIAIDKYLDQKVYIDSVQLKNLSACSFTKLEIKQIMKNDLYLLFWILPNEVSQYRNDQYKHAIRSMENELKNSEKSLQNKYKYAFLIELKKEKSQVLKYKQISVILNSSLIRQFYVFKNNQESTSVLLRFIKNCVISRAVVSRSDAYYSWSFLLNVVRQNHKGPQFIFEIISTLREQISKAIILQTPRQATLLLPFLANLPNYFTNNFYNRQLLEQRLRNSQILTRRLSKKEHKKIISILKKSSAEIINNLLVQYSKLNEIILKNIIDFICACKFIPMFREEADQINSFLDLLTQNDKCGIDRTKIQIAKKIIADRQKIIQSENNILSQNFTDKYKQESQTCQGKLVRSTYQNQQRSSDRASYSQQTKSSKKSKLKPNAQIKDNTGVFKQENLEKINLFSEYHKEKPQKTEKNSIDRSLLKNIDHNLQKNTRPKHIFQKKQEIQFIQILDDNE